MSNATTATATATTAAAAELSNAKRLPGENPFYPTLLHENNQPATIFRPNAIITGSMLEKAVLSAAASGDALSIKRVKQEIHSLLGAGITAAFNGINTTDAELATKAMHFARVTFPEFFGLTKAQAEAEFGALPVAVAEPKAPKATTPKAGKKAAKEAAAPAVDAPVPSADLSAAIGAILNPAPANGMPVGAVDILIPEFAAVADAQAMVPADANAIKSAGKVLENALKSAGKTKHTDALNAELAKVDAKFKEIKDAKGKAVSAAAKKVAVQEAAEAKSEKAVAKKKSASESIGDKLAKIEAQRAAAAKAETPAKKAGAKAAAKK